MTYPTSAIKPRVLLACIQMKWPCEEQQTRTYISHHNLALSTRPISVNSGSQLSRVNDRKHVVGILIHSVSMIRRRTYTWRIQTTTVCQTHLALAHIDEFPSLSVNAIAKSQLSKINFVLIYASSQKFWEARIKEEPQVGTLSISIWVTQKKKGQAQLLFFVEARNLGSSSICGPRQRELR